MFQGKASWFKLVGRTETGEWTEITIDTSLSITFKSFITLSQKPNENKDGKEKSKQKNISKQSIRASCIHVSESELQPPLHQHQGFAPRSSNMSYFIGHQNKRKEIRIWVMTEID